MASEAEKEQAKLTASYVNGIAITIFALGCASPIPAGVYGNASLGAGTVQLYVITSVCFAISLGIDLAARWILKSGFRQ